MNYKIADWSLKEIADENFKLNFGYFQTGEYKKYESYYKLKEAFEFILNTDNREQFSSLEIGCGAGWQIRYLYEEGISKYLQYKAMDLSQHMINYAKTNFPSGEYFIGDVVAEHPDEKFDIVFEAATIQLVSDWRAGLKNMIECSNDWVISHRLFYTDKESYTIQTTTYNNIPDCRHFVNLNELKHIFEAHNFQVVKEDLWRKDMGTFVARRKND